MGLDFDTSMKDGETSTKTIKKVNDSNLSIFQRKVDGNHTMGRYRGGAWSRAQLDKIRVPNDDIEEVFIP